MLSPILEFAVLCSLQLSLEPGFNTGQELGSLTW